jgi:hypothetical protein
MAEKKEKKEAKMARAEAMEQLEREFRAEQTVKQLEEIGAKIFFEKLLTTSDVSASGRIVVPKAVAEQFFPRLDVPGGTELVAEDAAGGKHTLRFRFWVNNQSRMYLLEGTSGLQRHYKLKQSDVLIFAQKADGTIVLAGRPQTKTDAAKKAVPRRPSPGPKAAGVRKDATAARASKERKRRAQLRHGGEELEVPVDGVFRSLPPEAGSSLGLGEGKSVVSQGADGRWAAAVNLGGEVYQAFFVQQVDALEALNAAGYAASSG